jgi:hypothetical protein
MADILDKHKELAVVRAKARRIRIIAAGAFVESKFRKISWQNLPVERGYLCFLIFLSADALWIAIWSVLSLLMMY